ncbi:hypothetical protein J7E25_05895 [Agromyces sp. ISL-38]|uniref:hypothetical protein n=1 Tax=Agromyces sp. ISL-38 TaxID=2819107 RepID=UPI001BE79CCD|nr:hypothetical protein [Agromyces sp. ISL-38]MBT2498621.1 hypothetical protein [Agromyces sp. ISL-38]MBT2518863.1 hypothetical protein [Streptomyces sp. ISL-90]
MTEGASTDKLSTKRQFALVVRVAIEGNGEITGELVDPISEQRRRFTETAALVDEVRHWIDDVVGGVSANGRPSAE